MVFQSGLQYGWKPGSRIKADAQKTGELCEQLRDNGGLSPESLLEASRREGDILHGEFEWDDSAAAEKYRLEQSAHIIRSIIIVQREEDEAEEPDSSTSANQAPVRAYFPVSSVPGRYESITVIAKDEDLRKQMLDNCLNELRAFQRKYSALKEVVASIETPIGLIQQYLDELDKRESV